jgi:putative hydrolases of HD superfamily
MNLDRLKRQLQFVVEIDKLKTIIRQTLLTDGSRQEDSAEHSWHLAVMALVLCEYAKGDGIDLFRVLKMVLIHDLVEIDAGDTYCYDDQANGDKAEREGKASDRLFGLLPTDQGEEFRSLWEEFEERKTAEARFAAALDRLQPLLNNFKTNGAMWKKHGIKSKQVLTRNRPMEEGAPDLWEYAEGMIRDAISKGWLGE